MCLKPTDRKSLVWYNLYMIKEITCNEIPRTIYKRGFVFAFPLGSSEDIFFKVEKEKSWILKEYPTVWDYVAQLKSLPRGINMMKSLDEEGDYLLVAYNKKEIDKETVADFVDKVFSKDTSK
jgi:hypothetical protein